MNYNSVQEIIDAGITNMTVIRNNSKQDDGVDTVTGVGWFTFNGTVASSIYVSGNTFFGFGTNAEQLKVNRRDTAMFYLYREEGLLMNYYRFLKIRWSGYSQCNYTSAGYKLTYDVILWDTGDISLHMVDVPTSYYNGTFSLLDVAYTAPTATTPDVTFRVQENGSFVSSNDLIVIDPPYDRKYLIQSGDSLFSVVEGVLTAVEGSVNAELFRAYGADEVPSSDLLNTLTDPVVLYWVDTTEYEIDSLVAVEQAVPYAQTVESPDYNMEHSSILGIEKVLVDASDGVRFAISFDSGQTWKIHTGEAWATLSEGDTGMSPSALSAITTEDWNAEATTGKFRFRITLPTVDDYVNSLVVDYLN
jgi:hypothetical protein